MSGFQFDLSLITNASDRAAAADARNKAFKTTSARSKTPSQIFDKYTFDIMITPPGGSGLGTFSTAEGDFHALTCTTPTKRIASDEKTLWGPVYNIPYARLYSGDFEMTYLYNQELHQYLMDWTEVVVSNSRDRAGYYDDIVGKIEIDYRSRAETDAKVTRYTLNDVFPLSVNGLELDMSSTNSYQTGSVSFSFRDFELTIE